MHLYCRHLSTLVFIALCTCSLAQEPARSAPAALPDTAAGKRVAAYLKSFNSGDAAMREFFQSNVATGALQNIPLEARLGRYRELHAAAGSFTLSKVLEVAEDRARIVVDTAHGMKLRMEFQFEHGEPHKLLTIGLDEARPEDEGITPMKDELSLKRAIQEYVSKLSQADDFSGVVMVGKNGNPVFQQAWGYANREQHIRNTLDTRFNLGSINKSFTKLAVHQLAARGKLSFQDKIQRFLPDYSNRDAAERVTVQQLLDMSSGIGDFFGERYDAMAKEKLCSIADYFPLFADKPLQFEPGTQRRYSNGGYVVLGAIIEKASGMDYYSYVRSNLFIPAKMTRSDSFLKTSTDTDIAIGYTKANRAGGAQPGQTRQRNTPMLPQRGSSAGGGYATARDLLNYTVALQSPLAPATFDGRNGFGIAGGTEGVNSALDWNPRSGYAVIVLSNYDPPSAESVAHHIRALLPQN